MNTRVLAAVIVILGSILFLIAAFSPAARVFAETDAGRKLEMILADRRAWTISQWLFALGALVTAGGLLLVLLVDGAPFPSPWSYLAAVMLLVGAGLWSWHVYLRAVDPQAFVQGDLPAWHFVAYTLATQAGLATLGFVILRMGAQSRLPGWLGWLLIGGCALLFIIYLLFKDMPPFVYYILTLLLGMMLFSVKS